MNWFNANTNGACQGNSLMHTDHRYPRLSQPRAFECPILQNWTQLHLEVEVIIGHPNHQDCVNMNHVSGRFLAEMCQ